MNLIYIVIIGFIVGLFARFFTPGKDPLGFFVTTLLGIVGAFVGTFLGQMAGFYREGEPAGFIMSIIGAVLVLVVAKKVMSKE